MDRTPFKLPDNGLDEVYGFIYLDDEFLVIDLRTSMAGIGKEHRELIKLAPTALAEVRFSTGIFQDKLHIQPNRFDLLDLVPGKHERDVALRIPRKHRAAAEVLVEDINAWMLMDA